MTVLVTGSSGHLGEALMCTLRASGREAIGLDLIPGAFTDEIGSVADRNMVARCMQGADAVLHTATLHKPHVATHARDAFVETNVQGTLTLLGEAARVGVRVIDRDTLDRLLKQKSERTLYLLDVRSPEEYERAHPPGFISAPGGQLVQAIDEWVAVRGARLVLFDDDGVRARMTASWLVSPFCFCRKRRTAGTDVSPPSIS